MRIYISGPMTGMPDNNRDLFNSAEEYLLSLGHDVVNPCKLEHNHDLEGDGWDATHEEWEGFLEQDIPQVDSCDAIAFLKGWSFSGGAGREGRRAVENNMAMYLLWQDPHDGHWFPLLRITPKFFLENSTTERLTRAG